MDIMYEIPKDDNIGEVTITREYIEGTGGPVIKLRGTAVDRDERGSFVKERVKPEDLVIDQSLPAFLLIFFRKTFKHIY